MIVFFDDQFFNDHSEIERKSDWEGGNRVDAKTELAKLMVDEFKEYLNDTNCWREFRKKSIDYENDETKRFDSI